ncbi:unnamed protein product, partial [Ixodes pacificus]
ASARLEPLGLQQSPPKHLEGRLRRRLVFRPRPPTASSRKFRTLHSTRRSPSRHRQTEEPTDLRSPYLSQPEQPSHVQRFGVTSSGRLRWIRKKRPDDDERVNGVRGAVLVKSCG